MSFDMEFDDDLEQRRLQRLEQRYRRAQNALAGARAVYGSLRELPHASEIRLYQALQQVERAQRQLADIQFDIEFAEAQSAPPKGRSGSDHWKDGGR
jgi:chromosome segregation ATPase